MKAARAIRDTSAAAHRQDHGPSRHLLVVDEGTLAIVAEGLITASLQMQAREMLALVEAATIPKEKKDKDDFARGDGERLLDRPLTATT